jgi:hypothetical protein
MLAFHPRSVLIHSVDLENFLKRGAPMLKKLVVGSGLALAAVGLSVVSALAYTGTPGTSASTSNNTPPPGGTTTLSAHFVGGGGQTVTFSAVGGGSGCTVTFNPTSATTDASGNVSTTVTIGTGCSGSIDLTSVTGAQNVTTTITVGALPAAGSSQPLSYPALWIALLVVGLGLIGASVYGIGRRRTPATA